MDKVGLNEKWLLHDVCWKEVLGEFAGTFKTEIPYHGVVTLRKLPK